MDGDFRLVHITLNIEMLGLWSISWEFGNLDCPAVILEDPMQCTFVLYEDIESVEVCCFMYSALNFGGGT